jgi:hypothetical protein
VRPIVPPTVALMMFLAPLTACTGENNEEPTGVAIAPKGRYVTVAGTGPNGSLPDPIDVEAAPGGGLLVLTHKKGDIIKLAPKKAPQRIAGGLANAWSMAVAKDGTIQVLHGDEAGIKLTLSTVAPGGNPSVVASLPPHKLDRRDPGDTEIPFARLVTAPDGEILVLNNGWLLHKAESGKYTALPRPKGMTKEDHVVAASTAGQTLILGLHNELAIMQGSRATRRPSKAILHESQGGDIAPDGQMGVYLTNNSAYVAHVYLDGRSLHVLTARPFSKCSPGTPSGPTGKVSEEIGQSSSVLLLNNQLYTTDFECGRLLAVGLPVAEFK